MLLSTGGGGALSAALGPGGLNTGAGGSDGLVTAGAGADGLTGAAAGADVAAGSTTVARRKAKRLIRRPARAAPTQASAGGPQGH